jgi:hypothetical protein
LYIILVTLSNDELIAESSHSSARRTATAGNPEVNCPNIAPPRAVDHSPCSPITKHRATLGHPVPEESNAPLFENSGEELDYLWHKYAPLEKQRPIKRLRTRVLSQYTQQHGESLDALVKSPAPLRPTPVNIPTKHSTTVSLDHGVHKQKDLAVFACRVEIM